MISPADLKYFVEVARTKHLSRAAERLGVTQPALSHCLKRLENEAGCELFIRSKKGVELTSPGERLFEQSQDLMHQWERVLASVNEDINEVAGVIKLGCHTAVAQYTLPQFLPQLLKENQKLEIQLHHGLSRHLTEQVISSRIDVTFAVNPVAHPDLIIKEVCRDQVTFWSSRSCKNPDVLLVDPNLVQTQDLLRKASKAGLRFKRIIESSSLEVLAQLLIAGAGSAILPERVIRAMSDDTIRKLKNAPLYEDRICLIYKREFTKTRRGKVFSTTVGAALGH